MESLPQPKDVIDHPRPSGFPSLEPAYILKLVVGEGTPVGATPTLSAFGHLICAPGQVHSGSTFVHYSTPGGSIETIPGFTGPHISAEVVFGGDWIYFDPDQKQTRMNVKGIAKTSEGEGISFAYTGVSVVSDEVAEIFDHHPQTIAFGSSTTANTFEVGSSDLKGLENATWAGNGRFLMEDGVFKVETRISRVVASTDME